MKTALSFASINSTSLKEIIFMNRNKDYGAYALRNSYEPTLSVALLITILAFTISVSSPLFLKGDLIKENKNTIKDRFSIPLTLDNPITSKDENEIARLNETLIKELDISTIKYMVPVVLDDDLVPDESSLPTLDEIDGKVISTDTKDGSSTTDNFMPDDNVTEYQPIKINDVAQKTEAFSYVEEMPSYPGGEEALLTFMSTNIIYPEIAKRAGVEGKVFIGFIVEPNGFLSEIQLLKGIGAGCDEEAIRALKLAGNWNPGRQNGKAVRVRMAIPFSFQLR